MLLLSFWRCCCLSPSPISKPQNTSPLFESSALFKIKFPKLYARGKGNSRHSSLKILLTLWKGKGKVVLLLLSESSQAGKGNTKANVQKSACHVSFPFFSELGSSKSIKLRKHYILSSRLHVRAGRWTDTLQRSFDSLCLCK